MGMILVSCIIHILKWLKTDELSGSSGMCKAGFAGDDAPRAVFREFS